MKFESFIKNSDLEISPREKFELVASVAEEVTKGNKILQILRWILRRESPYTTFLEKLTKEYENYCNKKGVKSICNVDIERTSLATGMAYLSQEGKVNLEDIKKKDYLLYNLANICMGYLKCGYADNYGLKKLSSYIEKNMDRIFDALS